MSINKKLLLVVNPVAGKGRGKNAIYKAVDIFSKRGYRVTVMLTEPNGRTEKAIRAESREYGKIVAIGGDGTLNSVVNAMLVGNPEATLGYIPLGSTNDLAASLKLPKDVSTACARIAEGEPRCIDLGRFGDRCFTYIACTGLFSVASFTTPQNLKNTFGHGAYVLQGLQTLKDIRPIRYTVETETETISADSLFTSVSNTTRVGGVVRMPKGVLFDDGFFELTMIKPPETITEGGALGYDLMISRLETDNFLRRKIKRARIIAEKPCRWSLDGENGGENCSVEIEVLHRALRFIW